MQASTWSNSLTKAVLPRPRGLHFPTPALESNASLADDNVSPTTTRGFSPLICRVVGYRTLTVTSTHPIGPGGCYGSAPLHMYATCYIEQDITQKVTDSTSVTHDLTTASSFPSRILQANTQGTSWCTLKLMRRLRFIPSILLTRPGWNACSTPSGMNRLAAHQEVTTRDFKLLNAS